MDGTIMSEEPEGDPFEGDEGGADRADVEEGGARSEIRKTRERLEEEADRAVAEFDEGIVDLLAWLLDTETRARIYVYLRQHPESTSEEVADGTGLYPSTVREALAELHEEGTVTREKRESAGAGNNPYEYEAIAPSELVRGVVGQVQRELNTVFNLDRRLGDKGAEEDGGPVTITVEGNDDDPFFEGSGADVEPNEGSEKSEEFGEEGDVDDSEPADGGEPSESTDV